jgi:inosose dehydratase
LNDTRRSRRTFLAATAGAAVLPAVPSLSWATPQGPRGAAYRLKLGVASYSLRKFTLDQALEMCREMDVRYVNFKDVHMPMTDSPEALLAARKKVEAAGLQIMGGGTITLTTDPAQVRTAFQYAKNAGFPLMVTAPEPEAFDVIEKIIQEFDIKVAVHNHGPEDKFFPAPQDAMKKLTGRDKRFGLCMDIGHATRAGVDPVKTVDECKDRLLDLHVKDLSVKTDKESQTEVGKGALDIPGLFRALEKIGFAGHIGLEYEINETNPLPGMKESLSYMRGVLDAIEG